MTVHCPFCGEDISELHQALTENADHSAMIGSVCTECGEPLFWTATGFRKPSDSEYEHVVGADKWQLARLMFLELKRIKQPGNERYRIENAVADFTRLYIARFVDDAPPEVAKRYSEEMVTAFLCGAHCLATITCADFQEVDSAIEFDARRQVRHAEIQSLLGNLGVNIPGSGLIKRRAKS